jgi:deoxyribose-phosphate aldolase
MMTKAEMAKYIDHTLLKPEATKEQILKLCAEAKQYGLKAVCVNSCYVKLAAEALAGSGVLVAAVAGFPLGAMSTGAKAMEAAIAVCDGANEIDMVINVGALKSGDISALKHDIKAVVDASRVMVKVIIETCLLTDDEKVSACKAAMDAGAAFVKTSTGFSTGGATEHDVALMRRVVGDKLGVKASGGIRTFEQAEKMIAAGVTRIGAGAGVAIMESGQ